MMLHAFATLPPHFDDSDGPASSLEEWECILPGYSTFYSVVFRVAIPFLLASIVFHQDWIKGNFPENHHLFYSRLFTSGIVQRLRSKIEIGIFQNEKTKLVAIGVPQYVKELHKFDELHHRVDAMEEKFWGPFGSCRPW